MFRKFTVFDYEDEDEDDEDDFSKTEKRNTRYPCRVTLNYVYTATSDQ